MTVAELDVARQQPAPNASAASQGREVQPAPRQTWMTGLERDDRLYLERKAFPLRLGFALAALLLLPIYGPSLALVVTAAVLGSSAWLAILLWRFPEALLRWQLGLRLLDVLVAFSVIATFERLHPTVVSDHGYIFIVVFAAATHGTRGAILTSTAATVAVLLTRLLLAGTWMPGLESILNSLTYGLQFVAIGSLVAFLMRISAEAVARQDRIWQAEMETKNRALESMAAQLAHANRELEAFAYSVSHDLRAPLRSIEGFSNALTRRYADQLDSTAQDYLQRVRAASQRMAELIDDLLSLSRVTRTALRVKPLDLSGLAREIADDLQQSERDRQVTWIIQDDVRSIGDPILLRAALTNLLENAWKFTSKAADARIEFGVGQEADQLVYFVRDNGVGFDMAYADKLFGPFQRLHPGKEFAGTGIGLATVQRIVERHGGRVWAEGHVETGAVFYFTLSGPSDSPGSSEIERG